ncbi:MAG TPA: VOC family protein [Gemmatimonadota bacterium]|nr:VOC family protein [Gemmatimonadota bacterium]
MTQTTGTAEVDRGFRLEARTLSVSLTTRDLPASVDWYRDVLGFAEDRRHEHEGRLVGVSLRAGDVRILLTQDDGAKGWDRKKGEGFSLHLTTEQDIDAIADHVRSEGVTLTTEPTDMPWGARVFAVVDPDGFRISISSVPDPAD